MKRHVCRLAYEIAASAGRELVSARQGLAGCWPGKPAAEATRSP